ncbi:MAG: serine hydrolase domain-containing protein [Thiotrichales bacterium]
MNTGDYRPVLAYLDRYIRQMMRKHHIVGLSIAVLDDQHIAWRAGFGFADQAEGVAANADTRYRAGSISKIFTTAAVMQLAEADRIDLDAPLVAVLPEFAIQSREPNPRPITPRMLMNHHSGLPGDIAEGMWTDRPAHFSAVIGALRETYRSYPPNLVHAYSNIGFDLLGSTIERVSGLVYESYLRERLLTPLGMSNSAFEIAPPIATQAYDRRGKPAEEPALRDTPAGGLNTSAPELLQFARMLFAAGLLGDTRVLGAASVAEMQRPQNAASPLDADLRVGLGWHFAPDAVRGGGPVLMHDGGTINHRAVLMLLPEHKLAVAVLSNTASALEPAMAIAGQALALFLEAKTGVRQPDEPIGTYRFPAAPAEAFPGHYASELGFLTIRDRRGRLVAEVGGKRLLLDRRDNGYHGLEYRLLGLIPIDLDKLGRYQLTRARIAGHELLLAGEAGAFYLAAERIEPVSIPPAWTARLGRWTYSGRDRLIAEKLVKSGVELKIVDGFLLAEVEGEGGVAALALEPIADDAAIVRGLGRGRGETVHALGAGVGETLRYAGMTFTRERGASGP